MGKGYTQSEHMKSSMGGKGGGGGKGQRPHTGLLSTGNAAANVKGPRPDEMHMAGKKGIPAGHNFEQEIKETFKSGGYANIKDKAMEHSGDPTTHADQPGGGKHGKASGKAEHLPRRGDAYVFRSPAAPGKCGFGHSGGQLRGPLRLSGSASAHRIGSRSK